MAILVDSNVLLDVFTDDPAWSSWSSSQLARAIDGEPVIVNPIVYAEVSIGFDSIEVLDEALPSTYFRREALPYEAGFIAGKAFLRYRRNGGTRGTPLPDFYIGAHALVEGHTLLTRDAQRYASYFPKLDLITP